MLHLIYKTSKRAQRRDKGHTFIMSLTESRLQRLLVVRDKEESKGRGVYTRAPAQFRDTVMDTHKSSGVEDFGPRVLPEKKLGYTTRITSATSGFAGLTKNQLAATAAMTRTTRVLPDGEYRSVFRPTPEQEVVCGAAKERRGNVATSEWALLDTLGVQMFLDERDQKQRALRSAQDGQRAYLDKQMAEVEAAKAAELAAKAKERETVLATLVKHKEEEKAAKEAARQANLKIKADREAMLVESRAQRAAALDAKRTEEAKLLATAHAKLDAERAAAAARAAAEKAAMEKTMTDNAARLAARKEAEALERQQDEELMRQTLLTLERQEREREAATKSFHAMIEARASRAGQKAVEENRARQEREERLMKEAEIVAAKRDADKVAAQEAKKAKQRAELAAAREDYLKLKATRIQEAKDEAARLKLDAEAKAAAEKEAEERKMAAIRERTMATKRFVAGQMTETVSRSKVDDVFMTEAERKLNKRLIEQAKAVVQEPKQYSVRL